MTFGLSHIIAPQPTQVTVQAHTVADVLATIALLTRKGGDDRHIGINEWVDRTRLALSDKQIDELTLVMWGMGIEGLLNAVDDPTVMNDFPQYIQRLSDLDPIDFRDTCLHWLIHSTHRRVFVEVEPLDPISPDKLLFSRDRFEDYLHDNITKTYLQDNFDTMADLYFNPTDMHLLAIRVLRDLWETHFCDEWARHNAEIHQVVQAFNQVDTSSLPTYEAMQIITGRDLRSIFRDHELAQLERIVFVPSKHNGPYVTWFGNASTLYVIFTARMPKSTTITDVGKPDVNVLIQQFKALSDDNRVTVLLAIREQGELSTQDIIEQFDLNKSAASRYLGQLYANGFIQERRDTDGKTKLYSIDEAVMDNFLQSITRLLKP